MFFSFWRKQLLPLLHPGSAPGQNESLILFIHHKTLILPDCEISILFSKFTLENLIAEILSRSNDL